MRPKVLRSHRTYCNTMPAAWRRRHIHLALFAPVISLLAVPASAQRPPERAKPAPTLLIASSDVKSSSTTLGVPNFVPKPLIKEFIVLGNKRLSQEAIILMGGHKKGDVCDVDSLSEIKTRLWERGYFGMHSANADEAVRVQAENALNGECKVVITVDENDPITAIEFTGSGPLKPEAVAALLHQKPGDVYNPLQFRRDYTDIQELYNRKGYAVVPGQEAGLDDNAKLNVALNVSRVSEIRIHGNRRTKRVALTREMNAKTSDYFNRDTLLADRLRLLNTGLYSDVTITPRDAGPGKVLLDLEVKEQQDRQILGGVSYSQTDQLVGTLSLSDNNFRGLGESVSLNGELGTNLRRKVLDLNYTRPWLDREHTGLSLNVYTKTQNQFSNSLSSAISTNTGTTTTTTNNDQYYQRRDGGSITLSRPLFASTRGLLTLRGEAVKTDPINLSGVSAAILQDGPLYSIGTAMQRDTRDLIADPVKGSYQLFNFGVGYANIKPVLALTSDTPNVFGQTNFAKSSLELRQYVSLGGARRRDKPEEEKSALAVRLLAGSSIGRLPFTEQFFLGGAESLRGYRDERFWGSNILLSSVEVRQPIARKLKAVLFADLGSAWGGSYSNVKIQGFNQSDFAPHYGVGAGLRVTTPLGALRFDYALGEEGPRAHFSFGQSF